MKITKVEFEFFPQTLNSILQNEKVQVHIGIANFFTLEDSKLYNLAKLGAKKLIFFTSNTYIL